MGQVGDQCGCGICVCVLVVVVLVEWGEEDWGLENGICGNVSDLEYLNYYNIATYVLY